MSPRRARSCPRPLVALVAGVVLAVGVAPLLAAGPAAAQPPRKVVVKDGEQSGEGYDVKRVVLRSAAEEGRRASARIVFAETPDSGDAFLVWFDLDKDAKPDALLSAYAESEWWVARSKSWKKTGKGLTRSGCFALKNVDQGFVVRFDPHCLAHPKKVRVSVEGFGYDGDGVVDEDFAPGERGWSEPVRSYR